MRDPVYDSEDDTKTLLDWTATIAAFFPDLDKKVSVRYNDRLGLAYYKSGLDALLRLAKRKDKAGEWSCTVYEDEWLFIRPKRPGKRGTFYDHLEIR